MARRFMLETRYRGEENLQAQSLQHRLAGLGYRLRPQLRLEADEPDFRFPIFERRGEEHESLQSETDRLKAAGLWTHLRALRLL